MILWHSLCINYFTLEIINLENLLTELIVTQNFVQSLKYIIEVRQFSIILRLNDVI